MIHPDTERRGISTGSVLKYIEVRNVMAETVQPATYAIGADGLRLISVSPRQASTGLMKTSYLLESYCSAIAFSNSPAAQRP